MFQNLVNQGLGMAAAFKVAQEAQQKEKNKVAFQTKEFDALKAELANQQAQIQQLAKRRIKSTRYGYRKLSKQVDMLQQAVLGGVKDGK